MSYGDRLASGGIRASFAMPNVSKEKWDSIFSPEPETPPEATPDTVKQGDAVNPSES